MKLLKEIKLMPGFTESDITKAICKKTGLSKQDILKYEIVKLGLDARHKPNVCFVLNVAIDVAKDGLLNLGDFEDIFPDHSGLSYKKIKSDLRPVVVGFGPAGMFLALALSIAGLKPIVLEQGKPVDERQIDFDEFWKNRKFNEYSNVHFGEGGAGTFSDGKLNTTLNNEYCKKVINELILNGAPEEIYYKNKAHIGTDNLKKVVKNIRQKILENGGDVIFSAKFNDFVLKNGKISSIFYKNLKNNEIVEIETDTLVLAIGHSAIDVFGILNRKGVLMRKKPFAIGLRIEHLQSAINIAQYGSNNPLLPNADYKLAVHLPNGRSVFTFCMCPGGSVVLSSSMEGTVVTNGMSEFSRDGKYANSAVLVNVMPEDFGDDVLAGFDFQQKYEKMAFELAGRNYNAPAETVGDFLNKSKNPAVKQCSFFPNVTPCDLTKCLPDFVCESLGQGILLLDKKLKGFANKDAMLIGVETRSSCPVQVIRNEDLFSTYHGLYAVGEGAGFAGGIVSSAVDGLKCAEKLMEKYEKIIKK